MPTQFRACLERGSLTLNLSLQQCGTRSNVLSLQKEATGQFKIGYAHGC